MSLKKCKIIISSLIATALFITVSLFSFKVYADSSVNPLLDANFSKYINVMHNDYFTNQITVSTLAINSNYNIGEKYKSNYSNVRMESDTNSNVGFKCNGVFYSDYIDLKKSGTYIFNIYSYKTNDSGVKECYGSSLEKVTITLDLEGGLAMDKTNFYYEHYGDVDVLTKAILNSFNQNVSLTSEANSRIRTAFQNFVSKYTISNGTDISSSVDTRIPLTVNYNDSTFNFDINLKSASNKELQNNFISEEVTLTKNIKPVAIELTKNRDIIGRQLEKELEDELDINKYLNCNEAQNVKAELKTSMRIPDITSSVQAYRTYTLQYEIVDYTLNKKYNYARNISFYNINFVTTNNIKYEAVKNEQYTVKKNGTFNLNNYLETVYITLVCDNIKYYDDYDIDNVVVSNTVNTSRTGNSNVILGITTTFGTGRIDDLTVKVVDSNPPKILTKYNYVVVDKNSPKLYVDQIKIIDDTGVDTSKTKYEINENGTYGGFITVTAYDTEGQETIEALPFIYQAELSFYQKTIGKWLYNYGQFLKKLF